MQVRPAGAELEEELEEVQASLESQAQLRKTLIWSPWDSGFVKTSGLEFSPDCATELGRSGVRGRGPGGETPAPPPRKRELV